MARIAAVVSNGCDPDPRVIREARWLVEEGHDVTIHAFDRHQDLPSKESLKGVRIRRHRVGHTAYGGMLNTWLGLRRFRRSVAESIGDVDMLHCHDADTLSLAATVPCPVLFDMHDLQHTWILMADRNSAVRRFLSRSQCRGMLKRATRATSVITSSQGFSDWLLDRGIESAVVENRRTSQPHPPLPEKLTLGYLGRVREDRAFRFLVDSIKRMPEDRRPRLRLGGDGTMFEAVQQYIEETGVDCKFSGSFDDADLPGLMAEISIMFAMYDPTRGNISEGALPVKMFDAAAFGRPTLVNADTPMGDLCLAEGLGAAVTWQDGAGLVDAIESSSGRIVQLEHDETRERRRFLATVNATLTHE